MSKLNVEDILEKSSDVANLLKQISHPKRLQIVCFLSEGELSVKELEELLACSQSQVSQFLKQLEYEGIVSKKRDGKYIYYSLASAEITKLMKAMHKIFC